MKTQYFIKSSVVAIMCASFSSAATQPQPDPDNPNGYILSKADITEAEQSKT